LGIITSEGKPRKKKGKKKALIDLGKIPENPENYRLSTLDRYSMRAFRKLETFERRKKFEKIRNIIIKREGQKTLISKYHRVRYWDTNKLQNKVDDIFNDIHSRLEDSKQINKFVKKILREIEEEEEKEEEDFLIFLKFFNEVFNLMVTFFKNDALVALLINKISHEEVSRIYKEKRDEEEGTETSERSKIKRKTEETEWLILDEPEQEEYEGESDIEEEEIEKETEKQKMKRMNKLFRLLDESRKFVLRSDRLRKTRTNHENNLKELKNKNENMDIDKKSEMEEMDVDVEEDEGEIEEEGNPLLARIMSNPQMAKFSVYKKNEVYNIGGGITAAAKGFFNLAKTSAKFLKDNKAEIKKGISFAREQAVKIGEAAEELGLGTEDIKKFVAAGKKLGPTELARRIKKNEELTSAFGPDVAKQYLKTQNKIRAIKKSEVDFRQPTTQFPQFQQQQFGGQFPTQQSMGGFCFPMMMPMPMPIMMPQMQQQWSMQKQPMPVTTQKVEGKTEAKTEAKIESEIDVKKYKTAIKALARIKERLKKM